MSVCNWLHGKTRPKAETVILVARVFGRSPVEALLAAGFLHVDELHAPVEIRISPSELSKRRSRCRGAAPSRRGCRQRS